MNKIRIKTPAKINLTLEVLDKRNDGFHNLQSIMQTINLYDFLDIEVSATTMFASEILLFGDSDEIPYDEKNLVYKACEKFLEKTQIRGQKIKIYIQKNIPVSAGLAGGSSNCAGTFFGLNKIFGEILSHDELAQLCASLGSDLNFCLVGGCCLCTGRGEVLEQLPFKEFDASLIKPKKLGISAKEAYQKFGLLNDKTNPNCTMKLKDLLLQGNFDSTLIYNSLERAVIKDYEQLNIIKKQEPMAFMSGSGPTFFVLQSKITSRFDEDFLVIEGLKSINEGVSEA